MTLVLLEIVSAGRAHVKGFTRIGLRVLDRHLGDYRDRKNGHTVWLQDSADFGDCPFVIRDVLQHMRSKNKIKRLVVKRKLLEVDSVVDSSHAQVSGFILPEPLAKELPKKRLGREVEHPKTGGVSRVENIPEYKILKPVPFAGAAVWTFRASSEARGGVHIHEGACIAAQGALKRFRTGCAKPEDQGSKLVLQRASVVFETHFAVLPFFGLTSLPCTSVPGHAGAVKVIFGSPFRRLHIDSDPEDRIDSLLPNPQTARNKVTDNPFLE